MGRCRRRGLRLRGCSGKNECVCHPGADSARLFHLAGGSPGDLIKTARKLIRHSHAAVSAEDLCYWIAAALYLFVRIYGENSGILRGYLFGGILGGAALYHASFGRFLPELLAKGIKKAGRILAFPGKWLVKSMKKRRKRLKFHGKNGKM